MLVQTNIKKKKWLKLKVPAPWLCIASEIMLYNILLKYV